MQVGGLGNAALFEAATEVLFDGVVGVCVTNPRDPATGLFTVEEAHIAQARPIRRSEFAAGRRAARGAMGKLGLPAVAIPAAPDRAPVWPNGIVGSISHSARHCVAVVSQTALGVGIDIEEATPLDADLIPTVCTADELEVLPAEKLALRAKLIFCAKEAVYKAQYPLTKTLFGFDHLFVTLNLVEHRFTARFQHDVAHIRAGTLLEGRFAQVADHFITGVALPRDADSL